ncbi:MAG: hydrolase, partial [Chlamydiales bacterium]
EQMVSLKKDFEPLEGVMQELVLPSYAIIDERGNKTSVPLGKALHITKRSDAPIKILLGGHMDTVYSKNSSFQKVIEIDEKKLGGPGVCDMKGGIAVLLIALQALEKSPYASKIGWEVIINPDEEIGSPGSFEIFERAAKRNQLGLLFEPALADGSIVTERSGSMNLVVVVKGKAAHAGRDFEKGKNAIFAGAALVHDIEKINIAPDNSATINIGEFRSGNSFNIVPDLAIIRINVRAPLPDTMQNIKAEIQRLASIHSTRDGISIELIDQTIRFPKKVDAATEKIMGWLNSCAQEFDISLSYKSTRGASYGNILSSAGLPTIDSLGVMGGEIHTHNEFLHVDSLTEKAKIVALLLMKIGNGEFNLQSPQRAIAL